MLDFFILQKAGNTRQAANKSATKNTLNILVTSIEITNATETTNKVINLASSDFFLRIGSRQRNFHVRFVEKREYVELLCQHRQGSKELEDESNAPAPLSKSQKKRAAAKAKKKAVAEQGQAESKEK